MRVLVVDDHDVLRHGIRAVLALEENVSIVGEARSGEQALRMAVELRPDVVVLDLLLPGMNGLEACRRMMVGADCRIIILTHLYSHDTITRAFEAGCRGFVSKTTASEDLRAALRAVMRGQTYVASSLAGGLLERPPNVGPGPHVPRLTPRETQVLNLIAQGETNQGIANALVVSVKTVQTHRTNIVQKLDLHSRADLVRYAVQHGLADLGM
ncbi:MAG: response regulator [Candidatus Xenobia bacterium]